MILTILLVLLICSLLVGGYGTTRADWGPYWGWSPLGFILVLLLVLWLLGVVH